MPTLAIPWFDLDRHPRITASAHRTASAQQLLRASNLLGKRSAIVGVGIDPGNLHGSLDDIDEGTHDGDDTRPIVDIDIDVVAEPCQRRQTASCSRWLITVVTPSPRMVTP